MKKARTRKRVPDPQTTGKCEVPLFVDIPLHPVGINPDGSLVPALFLAQQVIDLKMAFALRDKELLKK